MGTSSQGNGNSQFSSVWAAERRLLLLVGAFLVALLIGITTVGAVRFENDQARLYAGNLRAVVEAAAGQLEESIGEVERLVTLLAWSEATVKLEGAQLQDLLEQIVTSLQEQAAVVAVVARDGEIFTAAAEAIGLDVSDMLKRARKGCSNQPGTLCVKHVGLGLDEHLLVVSAPHQRGGHNVRDTVLCAVAISWEEVGAAITDTTKLDQWSKAFILDGNGALLSWPDGAKPPGFRVVDREASCAECHLDLNTEHRVTAGAWSATTLEIQNRPHIVATESVAAGSGQMVVGLVAPRRAALARHGPLITWGVVVLLALGITVGIVVYRLHRLGTRQVGMLQHASEEVLRLNEQLEEKVKSRTQELEEAHGRAEQLQRQHAALDRLAVVGELAAAFAHEVRTPLNALFIAQQRLARIARRSQTVDPKVALEILESQGRDVEVINNCVENYLRFTRKARATASAKASACDVPRLIQEACRYVSSEARRARVELRANTEPPDLVVQLDEGKLRHVLVNLVLNAVQAQPEGGEVVVSARVADGQLCLEIADRGPGVPPERASEIFEPFRSFREGGTGVGLAICQRLAKGEGALLGHRPRERGGSVFAVAWPIASSTQQLTSAPQGKPSESKGCQGSYSSTTMLQHEAN